MPGSPSAPAIVDEPAFVEVVAMIQASRGQALAAVNTALVELYWRIGAFIARKLETATWGEGVVDALARYIADRHPNLTGFTRRNLFRMRQFYTAYADDPIVSALLTQLPWTHHLLILSRAKRAEERAVLSPPHASAALRAAHPDATSAKPGFHRALETTRSRISYASAHRGRP